jgi:hypothetical protein
MPAPSARSAIEALGRPGTKPRKPGVYNKGLIVLLDDAFNMRSFDSWPTAEGDRFSALAYTGLGDFLLWDHQKNVVQYLDVQQAMLTEAREEGADNIDAVLDETFTRPEVIDGVLQREHVAEIIMRKKPLRYGDCYILVPYLAMGGIPEPRNYSTGDVSAYINLAGQTFF